MAEDIVLKIDQIQGLLPHRYPFLLVDRVLEIHKIENETNLGSYIRAVKNVTMNEEFFQGHFPGHPVMPGVLIVEALAQASALLCAGKPHPSGGKWTFYILGVDQAKFRKPVTPGDVVELKSTITRDRKTTFVFKCEAFVQGGLVAEAEIMAKMF